LRFQQKRSRSRRKKSFLDDSSHMSFLSPF
jgi:hypothetical protein